VEGKMQTREVWHQHRNGNGNTTLLAAMAEMREV
jgi:ABC-type cobalamin transport system ATPase subunit